MQCPPNFRIKKTETLVRRSCVGWYGVRTWLFFDKGLMSQSILSSLSINQVEMSGEVQRSKQ